MEGITDKKILQHTATQCNTLQHTATHCNTLQHTATHCNTLQHTATHCNTQTQGLEVEDITDKKIAWQGRSKRLCQRLSPFIRAPPPPPDSTIDSSHASSTFMSQKQFGGSGGAGRGGWGLFVSYCSRNSLIAVQELCVPSCLLVGGSLKDPRGLALALQVSSFECA